MKRRLFWTVPGMAAGAAVAFVWLTVYVRMSKIEVGNWAAIPLVAVAFLFLNWVLVVLPFVVLCKDKSVVYRPKIAPWVGSAVGLGAWLVWTFIFLTAAQRMTEFGRLFHPDHAPATLVLATGPAIVGAVVGATIALFRSYGKA